MLDHDNVKVHDDSGLVELNGTFFRVDDSVGKVNYKGMLPAPGARLEGKGVPRKKIPYLQIFLVFVYVSCRAIRNAE